jgi:CDP-diacylglycerol--glycerol-3-phosphate 3-phosphatidyltransferase
VFGFAFLAGGKVTISGLRRNLCKPVENETVRSAGIHDIVCGMTTANKITVLRILLIPFFVVESVYYVRTGNEVYRLVGMLSFAVAAILDGVDGYVARRYNQWSELGTILDPLADKLLLVSAIVLLSFDNTPYFRQFPLWLTGLIIGRDVLLAIGALVLHLIVGKVTVRPHLTGKLATVFQMLTVSWILLKWDFNYGLLKVWILGAGLFTGVSGLFYLGDWMQQLGRHPASSPVDKNKDGK